MKDGAMPLKNKVKDKRYCTEVQAKSMAKSSRKDLLCTINFSEMASLDILYSLLDTDSQYTQMILTPHTQLDSRHTKSSPPPQTSITGCTELPGSNNLGVLLLTTSRNKQSLEPRKELCHNVRDRFK
jgi:hypothetical protein